MGLISYRDVDARDKAYPPGDLFKFAASAADAAAVIAFRDRVVAKAPILDISVMCTAHSNRSRNGAHVMENLLLYPPSLRRAACLMKEFKKKKYEAVLATFPDNPRLATLLRLTRASSSASGLLFVDVSAKVLGIVNAANDKPITAKNQDKPYPVSNGRVVKTDYPEIAPPNTPFDAFCMTILEILAQSEMRRLALCAAPDRFITEGYILTKVGQAPGVAPKNVELPRGQNVVLAMARIRPESTTPPRRVKTLFTGEGFEVAGFISMRPSTDNHSKFPILGRAPPARISVPASG